MVVAGVFRFVRIARSVAGVCALISLVACGGGQQQVADPLPPGPTSWQVFFPQPAVVDGETLTPTCSKAPGTNPQFRFWARRGTADGLVIFFEGGGACWDDATCSLGISAANPNGLYYAEILPSYNPSTYNGLFNLTDARNPVKDWSFVYVPYCTGDIHAGSKTKTYTNPFNGQQYTIEHRGVDNFRLVLRWIQQNFAPPQQILVTGSSAGAYGAVAHFPRIRRAFPSGMAAMLGDAGQGVATPAFDQLRNANWNIQLDPGVYGPNPQSVPSEQLAQRLAQAFPADRFGQYTTALDLIQMAFYDVMVNGLTGAQEGTACQAWTDSMATQMAVNRQVPNFRGYMAAGTTHTVLRGQTFGDPNNVPLFFRENSAGGAPFTDWLAGMLSPNGANWANRDCVNCTTFPPGQCPY